MKRTTIFLAALALVAASCTKTEVVSDKTQDSVKGIGFSAYTSRPTKAAQEDVTTANLSSFQVTAVSHSNHFTLFEDITFSHVNTGDPWVSDPIYFWPNYALDFYAYNTPTPGNGTLDKNAVASEKKLTFTPSTDISKQEDLVAAYVENKTDPGAPIDITFHHYLTQVIVKAKNSSTSYKVEVDGVKLANFCEKGSYTFINNTMTAEGNKINYSATFNPAPLTDTESEMMTNGNDGKWYLVPQTVTSWVRTTGPADMKNELKGTYLGLKVKITAPNDLVIYPANGTETAWMAVEIPESLKFEQGKKYIVILDFFSSTGNGGAGYVDPEEPGDLDGDGNANNDKGKAIVGGAIKFNATVDIWDEVTEITIPL